MKLSDYLKRYTQEQRADFALRVGTTLGHLNNVSYGQRTASAALTRAIADQTAGEVREWDLRPDWVLIWPELRALPGAPCDLPIAAEGASVAAPDAARVEPAQCAGAAA